MGNSAELEHAAREAFAAGGRDKVIDLPKVPSLTSAGVRTIVVIHQMLAETKDQARHLKLVNPTAYVREVLEIAGLLKYIEVYESIDEAMASF
jgi:anti-anti-sigma factor